MVRTQRGGDLEGLPRAAHGPEVEGQRGGGGGALRQLPPLLLQLHVAGQPAGGPHLGSRPRQVWRSGGGGGLGRPDRN